MWYLANSLNPLHINSFVDLSELVSQCHENAYSCDSCEQKLYEKHINLKVTLVPTMSQR